MMFIFFFLPFFLQFGDINCLRFHSVNLIPPVDSTIKDPKDPLWDYRQYLFNNARGWVRHTSTKHIDSLPDGRDYFFLTETTTDFQNKITTERGREFIVSRPTVNKGVSVTVQLLYAIYHDEAKKSNTTLKFGFGSVNNTEFRQNDTEDIHVLLPQIDWLFEANDTGGIWTNQVIYIPNVQEVGNKLVIFGETSGKDKIALANITLDIEVGGSDTFAACTFQEPELCNWTNSTTGLNWVRQLLPIPSKKLGKVPSSPHNDPFILLDYHHNSPFVQTGLLASPKIFNLTDYMRVSFWYLISPSDKLRRPVLKVGRSQTKHFEWIFDTSHDELSLSAAWYYKSVCTSVDKKSFVQFIFHGEVGYGSEVGLDQVAITGCYPDVNLTCNFDHDLCGWQMKFDYFNHWERTALLNKIPPPPNGGFYLRIHSEPAKKDIAPDESPLNLKTQPPPTLHVALLSSPPLQETPALLLKMWYYTNDYGNNSESVLQIGVQTHRLRINNMDVKFQTQPHATIFDVKWQQISVCIQNIQNNSKIILRAKLLSDTQMAIDDIKGITTDTCEEAMRIDIEGPKKPTEATTEFTSNSPNSNRRVIHQRPNTGSESLTHFKMHLMYHLLMCLVTTLLLYV